MTISIYCDGSSASSGGKPGGWAFVIVIDNEVVLGAAYGGDPSTTNNRMELTGAIEGISALQRLHQGASINLNKHTIELVSDSQYTLGMANGSYSPSRGADGKPKNGDLVERLQVLAKQHLSKDPKTGRPLTRWVRGHNGDAYNSRCDSLAKKGKKENTK